MVATGLAGHLTPSFGARLRELASERRRFGYRQLFVLLRREGEPSGINRIHRLYREEGLAVRKRRARPKACGVRVPILVALHCAWQADPERVRREIQRPDARRVLERDPVLQP
jgi:transposase InsO family protein